MSEDSTISRRALALAPLLAAVAAPTVIAASGTSGGHAVGGAAGGVGTRASRLNAIEQIGIYDLFARYSWSYDCADEAAYMANYTDDAIVVGVSPGQVYKGKEAIRGWYRYLIELRSKEGDDWQHDSYHHRMFGDRRSCLVYSYATHFKQTATRELGLRSAGYFVSECVWHDGEWLLRRHSVNRWDRNALPWTKPLPWVDFDRQ